MCFFTDYFPYFQKHMLANLTTSVFYLKIRRDISFTYNMRSMYKLRTYVKVWSVTTPACFGMPVQFSGDS